MKKFLVLCTSIILVVTLVFMTIWLVTGSEVFSLKDNSGNSIHLHINEEKNIEFQLDNPEKNTSEKNFSIEYSSNDGIIEFVEETPTITSGEKENSKLVTYKIKAKKAGSCLVSIDFTSSSLVRNVEDSDDEEDTNHTKITLNITVDDGSTDYPFIISTYDELCKIGTDGSVFTTSSNYMLANDIVANSMKNWTPIKDFTGEFNGNNKTISGLVLSSGNNTGVNGGLFAEITSASVHNLKLDNITADDSKKSFQTLGAVAGINNYGKIYGITVTNAKLSTSVNDGVLRNASLNSVYVGGIVGINENHDSSQIAYVTQSSFSGEINVLNNSPISVGGIVALNKGSIVGYSYVAENSSINASDTAIIGGIVGENSYNESTSSLVADSYSLAKVKTKSTSKGGIIGNFETANKTFTYGCYYLTGTGFNCGLNGYDDINVDAEKTTYDASTAKGICLSVGLDLGSLKNFENFNSYKNQSGTLTWDFNVIWNKPTESTTPTLKNVTVFNSPKASIINKLDFDNLSTADDLIGFINGDPGYSDSATITSDIDLTGTDASKLGLNLEGKTLVSKMTDGKNAVISGFDINLDKPTDGFFAIVSNSKLEGITFKPNSVVINNLETSENYNFGIIAGKLESGSILNNVNLDLTDCNINLTSTQTSTYNIGSIAGTSDSSFIQNCEIVGGGKSLSLKLNKGNSSTKRVYIGGAVAQLINSRISSTNVSNLTIEDTEENKSDLGSGSNYGALGGLVALVDQVSDAENAEISILNCKVNAVKLYSEINNDFEIKDKTNKLNYCHYSGGIVGIIKNSSPSTVDLPVVVSKCYANGVEINGYVIGGIVGCTYSADITKSSVSSAKCSGWKVGGIAGFQFNKSIISNCVIEGEFSAPSKTTTKFLDINYISNASEACGVSAVAVELDTTYTNIPEINYCYINCYLSAERTYKDCSGIKHVSSTKYDLWLTSYNTEDYKSFTRTAKTNHCVYNNAKLYSSKTRSEISSDNFLEELGSFIYKFGYSYDVREFDSASWNNFGSAFDSFDDSIWNFDKENKTISLK